MKKHGYRGNNLRNSKYGVADADSPKVQLWTEQLSVESNEYVLRRTFLKRMSQKPTKTKKIQQLFS